MPSIGCSSSGENVMLNVNGTCYVLNAPLNGEVVLHVLYNRIMTSPSFSVVIFILVLISNCCVNLLNVTPAKD